MEINQRDALFTRLLRNASLRANEILSVPGGAARIRAIADDGLSEIERMSHSPDAEDQLVGAALRLSASLHGAGQPMIVRMAQYFQVPSPAIEVEAVRRSIWSQLEKTGLPADLGEQEVRRLEGKMSGTDRCRFSQFRAYAALYSDLWCDPRTGAATSARRIMLAMVTTLVERSNTLRVPSASCETVS